MKFDAGAAEAADLVRCASCGKPKGYKGYHGPECQCDVPTSKVSTGHSIGTLPNRPRRG